MAFSQRDYTKIAEQIRTKDKVEIGGRVHYLDRTNRYLIALFMRDYFAATVPMFDGLAFLRACGF